jgi:hypothetical protein
MTNSRQTPIIIGVGDIINRSLQVEDAREPLDLIIDAIQKALTDSKLTGKALELLQSSIDSIDVVSTWTWPYPDLPGLIAERLKVNVQHKELSPHGGNQPAKLLDEVARRVSQGKSKVAVITGGEALASCTREISI